MSTVSAPQQRSKPILSVILDHIDGISRAGLSFIVGKETFYYWVQPIPCDWGTAAYRLEKFSIRPGGDPEETVYHVLLNGNESSCACKGFVRWGHCKHVQVLTELQAKGQL